MPPHQDRRLHLRMLGFVGLIGLIMFAWQAWRIGSGRGGSTRPQFAPSAAENDETLKSPRPPELKEDEFRVLAPEENESADEFAQQLADEPGVRIPAEWLTGVRDNLIGIRQREAGAYYRVLAKVRIVPQAELRAEADPNASYANLMDSPDRFRGRPVALVGEVRNLFAYEAPPNDFGVTQLYDAWILTSDSGNQPFRVVCQAIPAELKPGTNLRQAVRVTGYFFKKEAYETRAGEVNFAPTLLANRLTAYLPSQTAPAVEGAVPWLIGVIAVVGLAMLATVIGFAVSDSRNRLRPNVSERINASDADLLSKAADRRLSVEEALRRLENDEPIEDPEAEPSPNGNGHSAAAAVLPEELLELPTPLPPTRVPKRWEE